MFFFFKIRGGSSFFFFFSSRRRHTRLQGDWSSDVCSSDLASSLALQFHRVSRGDSGQVVTPFVQVGTYPTRNFATLGPFSLLQPTRWWGRAHFCRALHVAMQFGPSHLALRSESGVWSLGILDPSENLFIGVSALPAVVHLPPNRQHLFHTFRGVMSALTNHFGELLELRKVALLLRGEKPEPLKERDHALDDGLEVVHLVVPDTIVSLPHRPALQVALEQRQDHRITL